MEDRKITMFFELLTGVYGAAKMSREWPSKKDQQIRNKLWEAQICAHSIDELSGAILNAEEQQTLGNEKFNWPNVGIILSGCKRHLMPSHREYLPPVRGQKEKEEKVQDILSSIRKGFESEEEVLAKLRADNEFLNSGE